MKNRLVVINPNSNAGITQAISSSLEPLRSERLEIVCLTIKEGPPGIVTFGDRARVVPYLQDCVRNEDARTGGFVIACFGDPGLHACREVTKVPVLGIGETSFYYAMSLGDRFGIVSTDNAAIWRHRRYLRELGVYDRCAGDLSIGIPISDLERNPSETTTRLVDTCLELRSLGAESVIASCAGLASFCRSVEEKVSIRVIEPVFAATGLAASIVAGHKLPHQ